MKILHLCIGCFYIDNYSYQENMLPKFHKELGHDVEIITTLFTFDETGKACYLPKGSHYINEFGIPVTRLDIKRKFIKIARKLKCNIGLYNAIEKSKPDVIFIHGSQFADIKYVVKYLKTNTNVKVYVDNHADFYNSASNWISKNILHKIIWKYFSQMIEPYTTKFWGVLPARVDFLVNVYNLPNDKVSLLVMGADDEKVQESRDESVRDKIRREFNVEEEDFLIITGGKIDHNKPQTLLLMEAVRDLKIENVKLLIFGAVSPEYKEKFTELLDEKIIYAGWVDSSETYKYFNAAELVVFPGLHSVFWEQVVGLGKPCVFRHMEGFTHIDLGGNCKFIYNDSVEEIKKVIYEIVTNNRLFEYMKDIAMNKGMDAFSYKRIAQKSILELGE